MAHQVECVRIHGGETRTSHYSPASISSEDEIFFQNPTPTSALWKFPLVIRREGPKNLANHHITWLMIDDVTGFAHPYWQSGIGDAIVASQDGNDLTLPV